MVFKKTLIEGEISINKLARVACISTQENQEDILEKTKTLSNRAIGTFVRDVKNENKEGLHKPLFTAKSLHVQTLKLDEDIENQLIEMQEKGIDVNEFLRNALQRRTEEVRQKKEEIAHEQNEKMQTGKQTRYLQVKVRRIIKEEHGTKCSYPHCAKPAKTLHHTQRFALSNAHDPHFIAPLCSAHHEIAHKIDVKYVEISRRVLF